MSQLVELAKKLV